jgi:hypothetical protein
MSTSIRVKADDAKRLKSDTAFMQFFEEVRQAQMSIFANSTKEQSEVREEAHAILRALNAVEVYLDAVIAAETLLDRKQRK